MKVGYACINTSLDCSSSRTFRLANFSKERFLDTTTKNLACLQQILEFNRQHQINFFRISSGLVPFASHPVCKVKWQKHFAQEFATLGGFIKKNKMRVSMHPGQYTVINSPRPDVIKNAVRDLVYHTEVLDLMNLSASHKIQIHLGGVYGDQEKSQKRFIQSWQSLPDNVKQRLVLENDERSYRATDCLAVAQQIPIPIVVDVLHHQIKNNQQSIESVIQKAAKTWKRADGLQIIDYSNQDPDKQVGAHSETIDQKKFKRFLNQLSKVDFDVMFEVKDKEQSVIKWYG
ncbi:MAG: UV DNA damage repair endonuclease UvsE [Candidatus Uhrbacteria bacterium]